MAHKTKKQIVQRILQLIESQPRTINELAESVGSNWDTVHKALSLLKSIGLVQEIEDSNKRVFKKKEGTSVTRRPDTIFGIPINKEAEELCYHLFSKIKERWVKKTGSAPNKTQMQKAISEIADTVKLPAEIPRGWYLFGHVCILEYDPQKEYDYTYDKSIKGLNEAIDQALEIYSKHKNTKEVMLEQYTKKKKLLYITKLNLEALFSYKLDQNTKSVLSKLLYALLLNFHEDEDNKTAVQMLNTYVSIANRLFLEKSEKELEPIHTLIYDSFVSVWELMATYNLFHDLVHGNYGYSRDELKKYFNPGEETRIALCKEYMDELNGLLTPKPIDKDSELFKLMGSAKQRVLTKEEKDRLFEDYEDKDISNVFRELNLN